MNYAFVLLLVLMFSGCASVKTSSEYDVLQARINRIHDKALAGPETPLLFTDTTTPSYYQSYVSMHCPGDDLSVRPVVSPECNRELGSAIADALESYYYAADERKISDKCMTEPLICGDPETLEIAFRNSHNESIEASRDLKLHKLDDWRAGRISEQDLMDAIHFNFKYTNGKLLTESQPQ